VLAESGSSDRKYPIFVRSVPIQEHTEETPVNKPSLYSQITYIFLGVSLFAFNTQGGEILKSPPDEVNPTDKYLFFMHGKIVEKKGLPARSKKYGSYQYKDMLKALADKGFIVISEARGKGTDIYDYSSEIVGQVNGLISKGIPPRNITVSGFSKGGRMTAVVSSLSANKDVNYVILAGCRGSDISQYDLHLNGRILSIYDKNDDRFGSCDELFTVGDESLVSNEIVLTTGKGHGVFYMPRDEWIEPLVDWAKQ